MPIRTCAACGKQFQQGRGRPARWCPEHRNGGGKYGGEHAKLRAAMVGQAPGSACIRCGRVIEWGEPVHLDHLDGGGPGDYRGWSHASCNLAAGARKLARMRAGVNGRPAFPQPGKKQLPPSVPVGRNPHIEHRADCQCKDLYTSRCW